MPAGSYTITQPEADTNLLLIESDSGSHSVFVEYEVVSSNAPHARSDVTFSKYGNVGFFMTLLLSSFDRPDEILLWLPPDSGETRIYRSSRLELPTGPARGFCSPEL